MTFAQRLRTKTVASVLIVAATIGVGSTANADVPPTASNIGLCSSFLAQLTAPDGTNVRASVNHVIKAFGNAFTPPLDSPGDLYKVRAHQHVNGAVADECTPRQLPGGGQG